MFYLVKMPGGIGASKGHRILAWVILLQLTVSLIVYCMDSSIETPYMKPEELIFQLNKGDLVEFDRGSHQHWAMYYEDGKVFNIRKIAPYPFTATITLEKLVDVAYLDPEHPLGRKGNLTVYAKKEGLTARPTYESVQHALTMVETIVPYNLVSKNCEYYATLWKFGKGFTTQPRKHVDATVTTGLLFAYEFVLKSL